MRKLILIPQNYNSASRRSARVSHARPRRQTQDQRVAVFQRAVPTSHSRLRHVGSYTGAEAATMRSMVHRVLLWEFALQGLRREHSHIF